MKIRWSDWIEEGGTERVSVAFRGTRRGTDSFALEFEVEGKRGEVLRSEVELLFSSIKFRPSGSPALSVVATRWEGVSRGESRWSAKSETEWWR